MNKKYSRNKMMRHPLIIDILFILLFCILFNGFFIQIIINLNTQLKTNYNQLEVLIFYILLIKIVLY